MNVTNLLKKEIKLETSMSVYIWLICLIAFYYIPAYPVYIGCFYMVLGVMMTFSLNQLSHGMMYTVLLPVRKIDTVKARFLYCGLLEILFIPFAIIAAIVRTKCHFPPNKSGIEINAAYFGFQLIILAIFNFIFLGGVYKNPLKPGKRFLAAAISYFAVYALCELPVWMYKGVEAHSETPDTLITRFGSILCHNDFAGQIRQLPVLAIGLLIFVISWPVTFKRAAKQFEKYDM